MRASAGLLLPLLFLSTHTSARPQSSSSTSASQGFTLYAYGEGIGGLPVFEKDGLAYIGSKSSIADSSSGQEVTFQKGSSDSTQFQASGNSSRSSSDQIFFIPNTNSDSHEVGFVSSTESSSSVTVSGFVLFGHVVTLKTSDGKLQSLFQALPTDVDGIWALNWNVTDKSAGVAVALKDSAPSNSRSGSK